MIHWDPSQKFHFDLKYVKIPFLAGRAHCFGKECRTYLVFRILWCWLTSEDSKCVLIICRIRACCNIWNSTPLCFLYLQNTPLFPSFATTTQKNIQSHILCFLQQSWPWPLSPFSWHRRKGKRTAGASPYAAFMPSRRGPVCPPGRWSPCQSAWLREQRVGPLLPPERRTLMQGTASWALEQQGVWS